MGAPEPAPAVIVFAKAPRPGEVKTRLIPLLGAEGAAALHARLVEHALATVRDSGLRPAELHVAPGVDDPFFAFCAARFKVSLQPQAGGDLGARMRAALESALRRRSHVMLIGSDAPALTPRHLREADRLLREGADAVFAPCEDGGYALIGLRRVAGELFEGISWGGDTVMAGTRQRLERLAWRWREIETVWDVDRPEDHARLLDTGLLDARHAPV